MYIHPFEHYAFWAGELGRDDFPYGRFGENSTLAEIASLLRMREAPHKARRQVRELTVRKLAGVETRLSELNTLRNELQLLVNLCAGARGGCPIIKKIDRS